MNRFYAFPKFHQWAITLLMFFLAMGILGFWLYLIAISFWYYFLFFLFLPILQFLLTPFLTLVGLYKYLSPMLLAYAPSPKKYDLHNGTSFDYLFMMSGIKKGKPTENKILEYYLEGLLNIIASLEKGELPETLSISGTSYFFSESTARRFGFKVLKPDLFLKVNQYMNYLDLLWMYSRAKGKWTFPKLKGVKKAVIQGSELLAKKESLEKIYRYLKRRNTSHLEFFLLLGPLFLA